MSLQEHIVQNINYLYHSQGIRPLRVTWGLTFGDYCHFPELKNKSVVVLQKWQYNLISFFSIRSRMISMNAKEPFVHINI